MEITAIRQQRLYVKVAEQLRQHIDSGEISGGERLPSERDLAERFAVSRPTIREAMIALELAGRVEVRSGSGVYVSDPNNGGLAAIENDAPGPLELLEARYFIEGDAAGLAAQRASEIDVAALESCLRQMQEENREVAHHEQADERFHLMIAGMSGNSAIAAAVERLWALRRTSKLSVFFHEHLRKAGTKPVVPDHQAIVDAIRDADPDAARLAMRRHLQRVIDSIVDDDMPA